MRSRSDSNQGEGAMKQVVAWFGGLSTPVQITVVVSVGVLLAIGLFFGANYLPVVDGLLGVK